MVPGVNVSACKSSKALVEAIILDIQAGTIVSRMD